DATAALGDDPLALVANVEAAAKLGELGLERCEGACVIVQCLGGRLAEAIDGLHPFIVAGRLALGLRGRCWRIFGAPIEDGRLGVVFACLRLPMGSVNIGTYWKGGSVGSLKARSLASLVARRSASIRSCSENGSASRAAMRSAMRARPSSASR